MQASAFAALLEPPPDEPDAGQVVALPPTCSGFPEWS
ncbi:MAG: hypothetical protein QOH62_3215 [Solirubrobacteraceae bacterium]|nr:hypothetical protein [Solirubrobacteraceae bacterium]